MIDRLKISGGIGHKLWLSSGGRQPATGVGQGAELPVGHQGPMWAIKSNQGPRTSSDESLPRAISEVFSLPYADAKLVKKIPENHILKETDSAKLLTTIPKFR